MKGFIRQRGPCEPKWLRSVRKVSCTVCGVPHSLPPMSNSAKPIKRKRPNEQPLKRVTQTKATDSLGLWDRLGADPQTPLLTLRGSRRSQSRVIWRREEPRRTAS